MMKRIILRVLVLVSICPDEFKEMVAATTDASNDVYGFAMCAVSTEEGTFQILPWLRSVQNGTGVNVDNISADSAEYF